MRPLPVAPSRYYAALGDRHAVAPSRALLAALPAGFRLLPLAADDATAAAVRYVQVPRLFEMRAVPELVTLTLGAADLSATLGDDALAERALDALEEHADAALARLRTLCGERARILVGGIDPDDPHPWPLPEPWVARYNEAVRRVAGRHGALGEVPGGAREIRWRRALDDSGGLG